MGPGTNAETPPPIGVSRPGLRSVKSLGFIAPPALDGGSVAAGKRCYFELGRYHNRVNYYTLSLKIYVWLAL